MHRTWELSPSSRLRDSIRNPVDFEKCSDAKFCCSSSSDHFFFPYHLLLTRGTSAVLHFEKSFDFSRNSGEQG